MPKAPAVTWGLGLEHEFFVAAEHDKAEVRTLDSSLLVYDIQTTIVRDLCAKIEVAAGKKNALEQLFCTERSHGKPERLVLSPETLKLLKKGFENRFKGFEKRQPEVSQALETLSTAELRHVACMFAPLSVCRIHVHGNKSRVPFHKIRTDAHEELIKEVPLFKKRHLYKPDPGEYTRPNLLVLMKHVLFRSDAYKMYEDRIAQHLSAFLKKNENFAIVGNTTTFHIRAHDLISIRIADEKNEEKQEEALTVKQLLSVIVTPHTFVQSRKNPLFNIEQDGSFVEVKNAAYRRATVESVVREVEALQDKVLQASRTVTPRPAILPFGGYEFLAGEGEDPSARYAGSYHVWITLPHVRGSANEKAFSETHACYARKLQWLEPLLMACTTGDARAVGKGAAHPRCHMRFMSGIGMTDVCGKMRQPQVLDRPVHYFDDETALAAFLETGESSYVKLSSGSYTLEYIQDGATKPYGTCISIGRDPLTNDWMIDNFSDEKPMFPLYSYKDDASVTVNKVLKEKYKAEFDVSSGNDIRVECKGSEIKLRSGWEAFAVKDAAASVTKFKIVFANRATKERSASAPIVDRDGEERAGFEFRFMDNTPLDHMREIMKLLMLVAATCSGGDGACVNASSDKDWVQAVASILVRGVHATLERAFVAKLAARFFKEDRVDLGDAPTDNVHSFLTWFCERLYAQEKDARWFRWLAGGKAAGPKIRDLNTEAYGAFLEQRMDWPLSRFSKKEYEEDDDKTLREALADPAIQKCFGRPRALAKLCPPLATKEWQYDLPYLIAHAKKEL